MAIEETVTVTIAAVEVNDEYRVELKQLWKRTDYSPTQAKELAHALGQAAIQAEAMLAVHMASVEVEPAPVAGGERVW